MSGSSSQDLRRTPSDEELMTAVSRGDLGAFEHLVLRHQTSAWNAAFRFLGDHAEAEDMAQEAFLKILQAAPRYQATATFRTYLYRVISRLCLDYADKKRPYYTEQLPEAVDRNGSPFDVATAVECQREIRQALDSLPPNQRMAVILKYYDGLGYAEIAAAIETSVKAVERLLARARETLERLLAPFVE